MSDTPSEKNVVESNHESAPRTGKNHFFTWKIFILLLIIAALVAINSYGFFEMIIFKRTLLNLTQQMQYTEAKHKDAFDTLQKHYQDLLANNDRAKTLADQQEKLIGEWQAAQQGNIDKWYVLEAKYLTKLAQDHLQLTHDVTLAEILLERADGLLQNVSNNQALELRKSLTTDLANLKTLPKINPTDIYLQLNTLTNQVKELPLPMAPLQTKVIPESLPSDLKWWQRGLEETKRALKQIIIVRYNQSNSLPLVLPDEKNFLYQNMHAVLAQAMWALLQQNNAVYQASLQTLTQWCEQYFVVSDARTQQFLATITQLKQTDVSPAGIDLATTLGLFDQYLSNMNAGGE